MAFSVKSLRNNLWHLQQRSCETSKPEEKQEQRLPVPIHLYHMIIIHNPKSSISTCLPISNILLNDTGSPWDAGSNYKKSPSSKASSFYIIPYEFIFNYTPFPHGQTFFLSTTHQSLPVFPNIGNISLSVFSTGKSPILLEC